jgi:putative PIN family toxin of toxin-antitoxin system
MTTAVLDTNVIVQSLFASSRGASRRVLDAYFVGRFRPQFSDATLDDLLAVLMLPNIRGLHRKSDEEVLDFIASMLVNGDRHVVGDTVAASVPRDVTDTKFLALVAQADADSLVTNDRRHLLRLRTFGRTKIVTPSQFIRSFP